MEIFIHWKPVEKKINLNSHQMKTKILMVCLGNICRSPVAEGVLRDMATKSQLNIEVDSAGTSGFHNGEPPDRRTTENAMKNGIDLRSLRSRKFTKSDFDRFDFIYVMDSSNFRDVLLLSDEKKHHEKVDFLLNATYPGTNKNVPDPYYGGEKSFEEVFQLIKSACEKIAEKFFEK